MPSCPTKGYDSLSMSNCKFACEDVILIQPERSGQCLKNSLLCL